VRLVVGMFARLLVRLICRGLKVKMGGEVFDVRALGLVGNSVWYLR
jgi:hypothetical protein